jgi:hypothetical protein
MPKRATFGSEPPSWLMPSGHTSPHTLLCCQLVKSPFVGLESCGISVKQLMKTRKGHAYRTKLGGVRRTCHLRVDVEKSDTDLLTPATFPVSRVARCRVITPGRDLVHCGRARYHVQRLTWRPVDGYLDFITCPSVEGSGIGATACILGHLGLHA